MEKKEKTLHSMEELHTLMLQMLDRGYRFEWTGWSPRLNTVYLGHNPHAAFDLCRKDMGLPSEYFGWNSDAYLGAQTWEEIGFDFESGWGSPQYPVTVVFYSSE